MKNSSMNNIRYILFLAGLFLLFSPCGQTVSGAGKQYHLTIHARQPGATVQPTMYGVFFEDINFGADGGLYAELIKNRSFEFPQTLMAWKTFGKVEIRTDDAPFERNPHYVRLYHAGHKEKHTGLENEGFRGMGMKKDATYRFSVWARSPQASPQKIRIELIDAQNEIFEKKELHIDAREWKKYEVTLKAGKEESHALLRIFLTSEGALDLEHFSLFPVDTWKGRENGLRKDLAEALHDLKPGVFRFPGGCIVEGTELTDRYEWKKTVGPVENRPLNLNRWHYTFTHRFFPDYFQSYGLGFYEYFLLSEDLGAEPLPVINCGLVCQYQNNDAKAHAPLDSLDCYIQDALDLIEFANGAITSHWGNVRATMGHPEPFNLKFLAVGNEQWGLEYVERLEVFVKALRVRHPEIKIIGSSGPSPDGKEFDSLWPEMKRLKVDLVDEHYYRSPEWFLSQATRYDGYDRKAPKVFAGEYACHPKNRKNNFESALCEAAFMTGLERNADVVHMATYAPLFAHVDAWQWKPDMIWLDNLRCVKTPNYYVQQLYMHNAGTHTLPVLMDNLPLTGTDGLFASAVTDRAKETIIVKLVNVSETAKDIHLLMEGLSKKYKLSPMLEVTVLSGEKDAENTLDQPDVIIPQTHMQPFTDNTLALTVKKQSFYVITLKYT
jgi:alpha-L-arabinofuranosidase